MGDYNSSTKNRLKTFELHAEKLAASGNINGNFTWEIISFLLLVGQSSIFIFIFCNLTYLILSPKLKLTFYGP